MDARARTVAGLRAAHEEARRSIALLDDLQACGLGGKRNRAARGRYVAQLRALVTAIALIERKPARAA